MKIHTPLTLLLTFILLCGCATFRAQDTDGLPHVLEEIDPASPKGVQLISQPF